MKNHFEMMAKYNAWANDRIYRMAAQLTDEQYRRNAGAYFKSMHGTLNHLLVADRIWLRRLTGTGDHPMQLDAIIHDDLAALTAARQQEDKRLIQYVAGLRDEQFEQPLEYQTLNGAPMKQKLREVLAHVFNHQTHHRGQAHTILTVVGVAEPEPLDLLAMIRELG